MKKIFLGLASLCSIALVSLAAGLANQTEIKPELKNELKNNEISEAVEIGLSNPSAAYCEELGYKYETKDTKEGQVGVCNFPDSSSADAWEFYSGESGGEFSYCAAKGYKSETEKNCAWSSECSVCILPDGENIPAFVLMLKEKPKKDYLKNFYKSIEEGQFQKNSLENGSISKKLSEISSIGLLASFDWRNNGGDWLTPIKDQGQCGSCWAFASVGAHESQIDIKSNNPATDEDLAEQYLVSDCFLPANCGGLYLSDIPNLFNFHRDNGIVDEGCFPYKAVNSSCTPCSDYQNRLLKIEDWYAVAANIVDIKTALTTEGPLWVGLFMSSSFDANSIMRCNRSQDRNINHAVVIVGYNDIGGYWIVRNSWGADWGENGYFKVGYGECNIDSYVSGYQDIIALKGKSVGPVCSTNADCDDGLYCNGTETCIAGVCQAGVPADCSNLSDQCNTGVCDETADSCKTQPKPNGTSCDDGLYCNVGETCQAGECKGTPRNCDDGKTCTSDTCDEISKSCVNVWPGCSNIADGCCGPECSSANDADCSSAMLCWAGTNQYLYKDSAQAKKFCKCAQGSYGYKSYKLSVGKKTVWKYTDAADNIVWDVTSLSSRNPIYSVICADGKAYLTSLDYSFPK
ncbi:MAG: C1 family peptidase [Patescibacteria group bacterium]